MASVLITDVLTVKHNIFPDKVTGNYAEVFRKATGLGLVKPEPVKYETLQSVIDSADKFSPWTTATTRNPSYAAPLGKPGYVYLIQGANTNYYKIGVTTKIESRLSQLNVIPFAPLKVKAFVWVEDSYGLEGELHEFYSDYWYRGEWFTFPDKFVEQVLIDFRTIAEDENFF